MKRLLIGSVVILAGLAAPAEAQFRSAPRPPIPTPTLRPTTGGPALSPYLNLLRGGNPAANYYLGTVPEQQRRYNAQQITNTFNQALPELDSLENPYLGGRAIPIDDRDSVRLRLRAAEPIYGRYPPGYGNPLPMPPPTRVPPPKKDEEKKP